MESSSPLEQAVPDLFGPDSFGPAPGELIDVSLLDPAVATVPPKASALPRGAVPEVAGLPSEAFKVPQAPPAVRTMPTEVEKKSRVGMLLVLFVLFLATAGVAVWQLGLAEQLIGLAAPYLGVSEEPVGTPARVLQAAPKPVDSAEAEPVAQRPAGEEGAADTTTLAEEADQAAAAPKASEAGLVKLNVVSIPNGAFVSVNGKGAGRTPLSLEYEAGTKLSFFSKARGFLARRQQVTVEADKPEVRLILSPLPYVVEVVTDPVGARASAVGGGQVTTPGELTFRSMPSSRQIVISKDGYNTVTKSVSRSSFVEEKARMATSIRVTLSEEGGRAASEPTERTRGAAAEEAPAPSAAGPVPRPEANAEPAPMPVQEAPASSEPAAADAP
jgi:hypothetical protein